MKREYRFLKELRADGKDNEMSLSGYAALFNSESKPVEGLFIEKIAPGAFSRSLKEGADVRALFNHVPSNILGRTKNGTLSLAQDERGLKFSVRLNPDMVSHRDLHAAVARGDIDECSFGFMVPEGGQQWAQGTKENNFLPIRTLTDVDLFDVSAVTFPQYNDTNVGARTFPDGDVEIRSAIDALTAARKIIEEKRAADENESLESHIREVAAAIATKWPSENGGDTWNGKYYVVETYPDSAIICEMSVGDNYFRISYKEENDVITVGDELQPVEKEWLPSERGAKRLAELRSHIANIAAQHAAAAKELADLAQGEADAAEAVKKVSDQQDRCLRSDGDCAEGDCRCQNRMSEPKDIWDEEDDPENEDRKRRFADYATRAKDTRVRTKTVAGKNLTAEKFAFVGDANDTATWKLPVYDAVHARSALARFNQTEGIPVEKKAGVLRKIRSTAKRFGIDMSAEDNARAEAFLKDAPMDADEVADMSLRLKGAVLAN